MYEKLRKMLYISDELTKRGWNLQTYCKHKTQTPKDRFLEEFEEIKENFDKYIKIKDGKKVD